MKNEPWTAPPEPEKPAPKPPAPAAEFDPKKIEGRGLAHLNGGSRAAAMTPADYLDVKAKVEALQAIVTPNGIKYGATERINKDMVAAIGPALAALAKTPLVTNMGVLTLLNVNGEFNKTNLRINEVADLLDKVVAELAKIRTGLETHHKLFTPPT